MFEHHWIHPSVYLTCFRSIIETARDDSDLSDEQAANMRFVVKRELEEKPESHAALTVANQVKMIADKVEEERTM